MLAVKGLFDGKKVRLLEKVDIKEPQEVMVTFLSTSNDEISHEEILQDAKILAEQKIKDGWTKKDAVAALLEMKKNINLPIIEE